ncbi:MAG: hypothetical protein PHG85_05425 [Candidatus Altiarchaeota archaeon]|nr:hypothetical protein [Candidatus Altiarchaeota archaeon]
MQNVINTTIAQANITITNSGDEPAYDVIIEPLPNALGITSNQISLGNILPNQSAYGMVQLNIPAEALPGRYAMGFMIRYNDLNNYPFTFVTPVKLFYKTAVQSNVVATLDEVELLGEEKKPMTLEIQNRDTVAHQVNIKLYTPNQISVENLERSETLAPSSKTKVEFTLSPLGALPGGNFFVFAVIDYDDNGQHYSVSSNGRIITSKERSFMTTLAPFVIGLVILAFIALIYFQLRKDKPVKEAPKPTKKK